MTKKLVAVGVLAIASVFASANSSAAYVWAYNLKVTSVGIFFDGTNDVTTVQTSPAITGCGSLTTVGYWGSSYMSAGHFQMRYSAAMTAYTTGTTVDIEYDNGNCNSTYGYAYHGLRAHP